MKLKLLHEVPEEFYSVEPHNIRDVFPEPTMIQLQGREEEALFVSVLLHGNETTGFYCIKKLLESIKGQQLQRSLIIFIGNVFGCEKGVRHLEDQQDFNRVWSQGNTKEHQLARRVKAYLKMKKLFCAVDIHNNTGKNPLYSCVSSTDKKSLYLASLFSKTLVYFRSPDTVLTRFTSSLCPSVVLECGQPGNPQGIESAYNMLCDLLHISSLDTHLNIKNEVNVYHTVAKVIVDRETDISFNQNRVGDLNLSSDLDECNFSVLPKKFKLGHTKPNLKVLKVISENNRDITEDFIEYSPNGVLFKKEVIPSMFTQDTDVIKSDCLGYLMEHYPFR